LKLAGDIGRPLRIVYFVLGIVLIVGAWVTHYVLSWMQVVVLLLAGTFLLWLPQAGRCEACATLPATGILKNENGKF
jgi:hypothetical protein